MQTYHLIEIPIAIDIRQHTKLKVFKREIMHCIFCKQESSSSRSFEHIMPESIGSKKRILQPGVVCDQCNNYFARKVEQPILNHPSIQNFRAWYQVPNKRGKYPWVRGVIAGTDIPIGLRRGKNGGLEIKPEKDSDKRRVQAEFERGLPNPLLFKIEMNPPKHEMSRFLAKMALETVAEIFSSAKNGTEIIVNSEFYNNIRDFARYGTNYPEWPYSQRAIFPPETLMKHPESDKWVQAGFGCNLFMNKRKETLFVFCFYGEEFVINVGGPSIRGYEEWLDDHGNISPMIERLGCYLSVEGEGNSKVNYLHGTFNNHKGIEFDKLHGYFP